MCAADRLGGSEDCCWKCSELLSDVSEFHINRRTTSRIKTRSKHSDLSYKRYKHRSSENALIVQNTHTRKHSSAVRACANVSVTLHIRGSNIC